MVNTGQIQQKGAGLGKDYSSNGWCSLTKKLKKTFNAWSISCAKCSYWRQILKLSSNFIDIYLHFAIWIGQIQLKLLNRLVTNGLDGMYYVSYKFVNRF